jgi:hypothetical protein
MHYPDSHKERRQEVGGKERYGKREKYIEVIIFNN